MIPAADPGDFTPTERDLLVEAAIDVIGLWWIAAAVRAELGLGPVPQSVQYTPDLGAELVERVRQLPIPGEVLGPDSERVIMRSLEIIERFLSLGLVHPTGGALSPWYEPWTLSTSDALAHIAREWRGLDRPPNVPDVAVFVGTEKGARLALALWPEQFEGWRGGLLRRRFPNL